MDRHQSRRDCAQWETVVDSGGKGHNRFPCTLRVPRKLRLSAQSRIGKRAGRNDFRKTAPLPPP